MPQIFNAQSRESLRIQLLKNGFELIKTFGLKKTSISEVAKRSGIATGTFYNFFKTKEEFVYQIVVYKRSLVKEKLKDYTSSDNKMNREQLYRYLKMVITEDHNLFIYLNDADMAQLQARWPSHYWKNDYKDEHTTKWLLSHIDPLNKDCNWKVAANLFKAISVVLYAKVRFHEDCFDETLEFFINNIIDYVIDDE